MLSWDSHIRDCPVLKVLQTLVLSEVKSSTVGNDVPCMMNINSCESNYQF